MLVREFRWVLRLSVNGCVDCAQIALHFAVSSVVLDPGSELAVQGAVESTMKGGTYDKVHHVQLDVTPFVSATDPSNL